MALFLGGYIRGGRLTSHETNVSIQNRLTLQDLHVPDVLFIFNIKKEVSRWWFQTWFQNDPIWLAHIFQNGLVQPPTRCFPNSEKICGVIFRSESSWVFWGKIFCENFVGFRAFNDWSIAKDTCHKPMAKDAKTAKPHVRWTKITSRSFPRGSGRSTWNGAKVGRLNSLIGMAYSCEFQGVLQLMPPEQG